MDKCYSEEKQVKLLKDGTLIVTVEDCDKVTRVLIQDKGKTGCLFYKD